jgi:hypothetical protein
MGRIIHLSTYNTSYGRKKGHDSKCQFDSQSLKVRNHFDLGTCKGHATYYYKDFDMGYNFCLDLSLIKVYKKNYGRPKWWESLWKFRDS